MCLPSSSRTWAARNTRNGYYQVRFTTRAPNGAKDVRHLGLRKKNGRFRAIGAFDGERLVSIAGTHVVSPMASLGVVGNVLTHPSYRGRGLARLVTSRVTAAILDVGCALAVLTVDPLNTPAVRAYAGLGYEPGAAVRGLLRAAGYDERGWRYLELFGRDGLEAQRRLAPRAAAAAQAVPGMVSAALSLLRPGTHLVFETRKPERRAWERWPGTTSVELPRQSPPSSMESMASAPLLVRSAAASSVTMFVPTRQASLAEPN